MPTRAHDGELEADRADGSEARDAPDTSHVEWSALPDLGDDEEQVGTLPGHESAPDERQPPPETIWGAL